MSDINIGRIGEALNNKADRDLYNVSPTSGGGGLNQNGIRTVVETYASEDNWYRLWSDGWIEQGGTFGVGTGAWATATITLVKPMPNTNYNLWLQGNWSDPMSSSCFINSKTTTSANVSYANNNYNVQHSIWRVEGYQNNN